MAAPSPDDLSQLYTIFFPLAIEEQRRISTNGTRFVHYTSAQAAISMIKNKEVWMRQTSCMKDFSEVQHGLACLVRAYNDEPGKRLQSLLDELFPGLRAKLEQEFNSHAQFFKSDTYLVCVSEHDTDEDRMGRLSMWRAYGRGTGVALVLNSGPFLQPSDALRAYTSPVTYPKNHAEFAREFAKVVTNLETERDFIANVEKRLIQTFLFNVFRFAAVCTKHPGFREEREWRVVHAPRMLPSQHLIKDVQVIEGVPQLIYKVPLQDIPSEGLFGIEIPAFVDRIIIGPTRFPSATWQAFVDLLNGAGVQDPHHKVVISDIPLRT